MVVPFKSDIELYLESFPVMTALEVITRGQVQQGGTVGTGVVLITRQLSGVVT